MSSKQEEDEEEGQLTSQQALLDIVESFPSEHLVYAFGYGSGVFSQTLAKGKKHEGMIDMILVVNDAAAFHQANLGVYPHHYASWLRLSGPAMIQRVQRNFFLNDAKVLFHVVDDPVPMKYGVIHVDDLYRDLTQWESLYLAGRLHKPTLPVFSPVNNETTDSLLEAQQINLQAAVSAALLLFTMEDIDSSHSAIPWTTFYSQIAALSYTGDFRMAVGGEDPLKISKLVQAPGQIGRFQLLYNPILQPLEETGILSVDKSNGLVWNPRDSAVRDSLKQMLPPRVQSTTSNANDFSRILASIIAAPARHQSMKGIFTLGFRKSLQYASAKLSKGLFRKR